MQEITESTVTIFKSEYDELLENSLKYEMLLEALYNESHLNHNQTELSVESLSISNFLKVLDKFDYKEKLRKLQEKENKNER